EGLRAGMLGPLDLLQQLDVPDELVHVPGAERCRNRAHLLLDEREVRDDLLRRTLELGAEIGTLSRAPRGAAVEVALARHRAAQRHDGRRAESERFGA